MAANEGSQEVYLDYFAPNNSDEINKRFLDIRRTGIYSGGYLSIVNSTTCQVSTFVCEIQDGTRQIRVSTGATVNKTVSSSTSYVVIRWAYNAVKSQNFAQILAVATPATNDVVVGRCVFVGGSLNGFTFSDSAYPRTIPRVQDLHLKVEPTPETELRVRVRGGYVQNEDQAFLVPDQKSDILSAPASNSKIYLIYVDTSDGSIGVDTSGVIAATPSAPDYGGKMVLAEVTVASTDTNIVESSIRDVRSFLTTQPATTLVNPDLTTIVWQDEAAKTIKTRNPLYHIARYVGTQTPGGSWTQLRFDDVVKQSGITQASNIFTLAANRLYAISVRVIWQDSFSFLSQETRVRVLSGDTGWGLDNTSSNVSQQSSFDDGSFFTSTTQSFTVNILPNQTTTFQVESQKTQESGNPGIAHTSISIVTLN